MSGLGKVVRSGTKLALLLVVRDHWLGNLGGSCYEPSMTLARLTDVLAPAVASGAGVGAFNVFSLEHAEVFTAAADAAGRPVVLQISQNAVRYHKRPSSDRSRHHRVGSRRRCSRRRVPHTPI